MNFHEDVDVFKFTSIEAGRYYINISPNFSCMYGADAYNSSQKQIQVYDDHDDKGFYINADANQTYYIKTIFTEGTGSYTIMVKETVPPAAPTNLKSIDTSVTTISISWSGSTDNVGIDGYEIYRNGNKVGKTDAADLKFTDTGLVPNTVYTYTVKAVDTSGNISESSAIDAATAIDTIAPSAPTDLAVSEIKVSSFNLTWTVSTDNAAVVSYDIYNGERLLGTSNTNSYKVTEPTPLTTYNITVKAKDASGNVSDPSNAVQVKTLENESPTAPTGLSATSISCTGLMLNWKAATDNVGVTDYNIYEGTEYIGSSKDANYYIYGLAPNTNYSFTVQAKDAAENISISSEVLNITTSLDTDAPTIPDGLATTGITCATINLKWEASIDNALVTGYDIFSGDKLIGTADKGRTSYNVTGLTQNTTYNFTVKAKDASGNTSAASSVLAVKTLEPSDLIITDISYNPDSPCEGEYVTFSATIKNIGKDVTPDGMVIK